MPSSSPFLNKTTPHCQPNIKHHAGAPSLLQVSNGFCWSVTKL